MFRFVAASLLVACAPHPAEIHSFVSGSDGFDTASYWVDTGEEVVVFDAQFTPDLARQVLADIRKVTDHPVKYVVVTHPNPDKFDGAPVFQAEGAKLVASAATAAAMPGVHDYKAAYFEGNGTFPPGGFPALPTVDLSFDDHLRLPLDGPADIELRVLRHSGVSSTQTVAVIDGTDVIVGDLVAGRVHAWLEGGIVDGAPHPDLTSWEAALDELQGLVGDDAIVWPGRGESGPAGKVLPAQKAYLQTMDQLVDSYVSGLSHPADDLAADPTTHWNALTAQAQAAFPDYGLAYLITYGVYGLAFADAAE